jgi:hypothetical protein
MGQIGICNRIPTYRPTRRILVRQRASVDRTLSRRTNYIVSDCRVLQEEGMHDFILSQTGMDVVFIGLEDLIRSKLGAP